MNAKTHQHIEFLLVLEDGTWTTEIVEVPRTHTKRDDVTVAWANEHLAPLTQYRRVVVFAVYSVPVHLAEGGQ